MIFVCVVRSSEPYKQYTVSHDFQAIFRETIYRQAGGLFYSHRVNVRLEKRARPVAAEYMPRVKPKIQ